MHVIPPANNPWNASRPPNVVANTQMYGYPPPPPKYPHGQISTVSYPSCPPPAYQSQGSFVPATAGPMGGGSATDAAPPPAYAAASAYPTMVPSAPPPMSGVGYPPPTTDSSYPTVPGSIPNSSSPARRSQRIAAQRNTITMPTPSD